MDRFISLATLIDQSKANSVCAILENEHIPVMVEHISNSDTLPNGFGFRVLVPEQRSRQALGAISKLIPENDPDSQLRAI